MSCEVVQIGVGDQKAWAVAAETFRGVRHDRHEEFLADPATVAFVEAFLQLGHDEGHQKMWLITGEDNTAAKALYEATEGARSSKEDVGYGWQIDTTSTSSSVTNDDA